ncbi:2-nitropropane dioxygenase [Vararia minispora EC-137]|uniref:2-nitropropane dioxygenase n=1 Tax=Vararia minispora EC-137 TaxID=1314806 RepID=A0ACB8QQA9_9AGAM|nr:2-nitropropane dioxygenase [Vararia minispora EC-137]
MAGAAGGLLASQVTAAGGFGFMSPTYGTISEFASQFDIARNTLKTPTGPLSIGVGILGFMLDKPGNNTVREMLEYALAQQVRAVWLSYGEDLGKWVDFVRSYDAKRKHKTLIFIGVSTASMALQAMNQFKADVIVAQSGDGGGHGLSTAQSTLTLVTSILNTLPPDGAPPVVAAGGLVRANQVAAMLVLGAAGTVHGTLFLATPASLYKSAAKEAIIAADGASTVRSFGFDLLRGTTGWPRGVDGRGLAISSIEPLDGMEQDTTPSGVDLDALRERMSERKEQVIWAGVGVGAIKELREAADIVHELHEGALAELRRAGDIIVSD